MPSRYVARPKRQHTYLKRFFLGVAWARADEHQQSRRDDAHLHQSAKAASEQFEATHAGFGTIDDFRAPNWVHHTALVHKRKVQQYLPVIRSPRQNIQSEAISLPGIDCFPS